MEEDLIEILKIACNAPSGSNSQPWSFKVQEGRVEIIAIPEKDHRVLNFKNRGTLLAHGALIENISIIASTFGYNTVIDIIYPKKGNTTALIDFKKERFNSVY